MMSRSKAARWLLSLLALVVVVAGCDDDVTGPGGGAPAPDELWPTGPVGEQASWMYHWERTTRVAESPTLYASPEAVPPVPTFDDAYTLLTAAPAPDFGAASEAFYELAVVGPDTTATGVAGLWLRARTFRQTGSPSASTVDGERAFLQHLSSTRSELHDRIAGLDATVPRVELPPLPLFLRGGTFESNADHVALYGNLDQAPSWLYLIDDLSVGSEFTLQIAASARDDVYLHGQVRRFLVVDVAGRVLRRCVEMLYVLDRGVSTLTVDGGEAYYRSFDVGRVVFAPSVGPVSSDELIGLTSAVDDPAGQVRQRLELRPDDLTPPPDPTPAPDLENIWPNQDGDRWTYRCDATLGVGEPTTLYATREEVPPFPGMDEVLAWLDTPPNLEDTSEIDAYMRLEFDGMKTTESGAVGQDLTETFWYPGAPRAAVQTGRDSGTMLAQILRARPELRERAAHLAPDRFPRAPDAGPSEDRTSAPRISTYPDALPFILFGYAWEKTDDHIGTYGDLDRLLAWKFLESDLRAGHEFTHQLLPALADDLWLHGRVVGSKDIAIGGRSYAGCVEVAYAIDYGVTETYGLVEELFYRVLHAGTILYAPGIGPVACRERVDFGYASITQDLGQWTVVDRSVSLVDVRIGD